MAMIYDDMSGKEKKKIGILKILPKHQYSIKSIITIKYETKRAIK